MQYTITIDVYGETEYTVKADTPAKAIQQAAQEAYDSFGVLYFPAMQAISARYIGNKQYSVLLGVEAFYDDMVEAENEDLAEEEAYYNLNCRADLGILEGTLHSAETISLEEAI